MRTFEIIFVICMGITLLRYVIPRLGNVYPSPWGEILSLAIGILQFTIEGYRWQMLPAYALLGLLLLFAWSHTQGRIKSKWAIRGVTSTLVVTYLVSISLPILLPIPRLSAPTGPYQVGTRIWYGIDTERIDPYAPDEGQAREILVQAWYPTSENETCENAPWMGAAEDVAPAVADWINLPTFFLDHLVHVDTPSCQDAAIVPASDEFPVVLFSHGYGGFRAQNTNQVQVLASHGFVVLAVEHTYASVITVFPDGRVATHNPDTLPDNLSPEMDLLATRALGDQWAADLSFVLDQLIAGLIFKDPGWSDSLDLSRIGAFGHSTGGGAVIEFCHRDPRCQATLTLDPFVKPVSAEALSGGLDHFALHMFSETWSSSENLERFSDIEENSSVVPLILSVEGSAHYDFSDLPLLSPLAHNLGLKGPIKGSRMVELVNAYLLAYFKQELSGIPIESGLIRSTQYPEVKPLVP